MNILKAIWRTITAPARWAAASRLGLKIWSVYVDPPAIRLVHAVLLTVALPIIAVAADRMIFRGGELAKIADLNGRLQDLGLANITCVAERNAWEQRTLTAEARTAELIKRDPPSPPIGPVLNDLRKDLAPARKPRKKVEKPDPTSLKYYWPY